MEQEAVESFIETEKLPEFSDMIKTADIISPPSTIKIGSTFADFQEFENAFNRWKSENSHPFNFASSEPLKNDEGFNNTPCKYGSVIYRCAYYGKSGANANLDDYACPAMLKIKYCGEKNALVIVTVNEEHVDCDTSEVSKRKKSASKEEKDEKKKLKCANNNQKSQPKRCFPLDLSLSMSDQNTMKKVKREQQDVKREIKNNDAEDLVAESRSKLRDLVLARMERGDEAMKAVLNQNLWQNLWKDVVNDTANVDMNNVNNSSAIERKSTNLVKKEQQPTNEQDKLQSVDCYDLKEGDYELCRDCDTAKRAKKKVKMDACRFKNFRICDESNRKKFLQATQRDADEWWKSRSSTANLMTSVEACNVVKLLTPEFKKIYNTEKEFFDEIVKRKMLTLKKLNDDLDAILKLHASSSDTLNQGETEKCHCDENADKNNDLVGEYYFKGELLVLNDGSTENSLNAFRNHWPKFRPIIVRNVDESIDLDMWNPKHLRHLSRERGLKGHVQNCVRSHVLVNCEVDSFWRGFKNYTKRSSSDALKLKDWPSDFDFSTQLPFHYANFCSALPFPKYTNPVNGVFSLTTHLPPNYVKPDLGPKLYCAYEMIDYPELGTTNLHLDCGDATNVLVNVTVPKNVDEEEFFNRIVQYLETQDLDPVDFAQASINLKRVGALWTIFKPEDTISIRAFLKKISPSRKRDDPIHDQMRYINVDLRQQLREEYGVSGFTFVQMLGDAVFIPAGAAHQVTKNGMKTVNGVQNLACCIKVAEDFVSPEHLSRCVAIDSEFRQLTRQHTNHEDKLQLPSVILHSIKEAVDVLSNDRRT